MSRPIFAWGGGAIILLGLAGFGAWEVSLPSKTAEANAQPLGQEEAEAMVAALRHEGEGRRVMGVVGLDNATQTNDYVTTTDILRPADAADAVMG